MQGFQLVWQGFFNKWNIVGVHLSVNCLWHSARRPNTNIHCLIASFWRRFTRLETLGKIHRLAVFCCCCFFFSFLFFPFFFFLTSSVIGSKKKALYFILFSDLNLRAFCMCNWQQTWCAKAAHPLLWLILLWSVILFDIQYRADTGYCNATLPNRLQNCAGSTQHSCR